MTDLTPQRLSDELRAVLVVLAQGHVCSGPDLAHRLGVGSGAVWRRIQALKRLGIAVNAVSGKGYSLGYPVDWLDSNAILPLLSAAAQRELGALVIHDVLDSTNAWLADRGQAGLPSGSVCIAEAQSAGRGRMGRHWASPFGAHVYLSVLWRFAGGHAAVAGLSLAVGLAIAEALDGLGVTQVKLKWPNDLWLAERKLGGILMELRGEANGPVAVVVGIGLNVRMPGHIAASIDQPWIDLSQAGVTPIPRRNEIVASLLNEVLPLLASFEASGFSARRQRWERYDALRDRQIAVMLSGSTVEGRYDGVTADGLLRVRMGDDHVRTFASGDVSVRLAALPDVRVE